MYVLNWVFRSYFGWVVTMLHGVGNRPESPSALPLIYREIIFLSLYKRLLSFVASTRAHAGSCLSCYTILIDIPSERALKCSMELDALPRYNVNITRNYFMCFWCSWQRMSVESVYCINRDFTWHLYTQDKIYLEINAYTVGKNRKKIWKSRERERERDDKS